MSDQIPAGGPPSEHAGEPATPTVPVQRSSNLTRRRLLATAAGVGAVAAVGGVAYAVAPERWKVRLGLGPDPFIPDAPEGEVSLETVHSDARGQDVQLFTAVPHGYADGSGLPVVVILHGGSARAAGFRDFGFGHFLTQAVRDGAEPFVLAGADGGLLRWQPDASGTDNPEAMVVDELPGWLAERGFDADRRALWGWSMGGYGSLHIAEQYPTYARAVAAFSPALSPGDSVFEGVTALADEPIGIWCGLQDMFYDTVRDFVATMPQRPEVVSFSDGAHTRVFWNSQTLDAFAFLSRHLATGDGQ